MVFNILYAAIFRGPRKTILTGYRNNSIVFLKPMEYKAMNGQISIIVLSQTF